MNDKLDKLDKLAEGNLLEVIALLLWKDRHGNPELSVQINAEDIDELERCAAYLDVVPLVKVSRPQGRPAQPAQPATAKRSAMPAIPAEPPRPYVLVQMVDKKTGDGFKPIESTEAGAELRDKYDLIRRNKNLAKQLSAQIMADLASGTHSESVMRDAANALAVLSE